MSSSSKIEMGARKAKSRITVEEKAQWGRTTCGGTPAREEVKVEMEEQDDLDAPKVEGEAQTVWRRALQGWGDSSEQEGVSVEASAGFACSRRWLRRIDRRRRWWRASSSSRKP